MNGEVEKLIQAAQMHGELSEAGHQIGDLEAIIRYMWSQLPLVSKRHTMEHFAELIDEWYNPE